jgi:hypothetical protein
LRASGADVRDGNDDSIKRAANASGIGPAQRHIREDGSYGAGRKSSVSGNSEIIGKRGRDAICIRFSSAAEALVPVLDEVRDGDRGQDADDRDDERLITSRAKRFFISSPSFVLSCYVEI